MHVKLAITILCLYMVPSLCLDAIPVKGDKVDFAAMEEEVARKALDEMESLKFHGPKRTAVGSLFRSVFMLQAGVDILSRVPGAGTVTNIVSSVSSKGSHAASSVMSGVSAVAAKLPEMETTRNTLNSALRKLKSIQKSVFTNTIHEVNDAIKNAGINVMTGFAKESMGPIQTLFIRYLKRRMDAMIESLKNIPGEFTGRNEQLNAKYVQPSERVINSDAFIRVKIASGLPSDSEYLGAYGTTFNVTSGKVRVRIDYKERSGTIERVFNIDDRKNVYIDLPWDCLELPEPVYKRFTWRYNKIEECESSLSKESYYRIANSCGRETGGDDTLRFYGYKKYLGAYVSFSEMNANNMVKVQLEYSKDRQRFVWIWPTFSQVPCECLEKAVWSMW